MNEGAWLVTAEDFRDGVSLLSRLSNGDAPVLRLLRDGLPAEVRDAVNLGGELPSGTGDAIARALNTLLTGGRCLLDLPGFETPSEVPPHLQELAAAGVGQQPDAMVWFNRRLADALLPELAPLQTAAEPMIQVDEELSLLIRAKFPLISVVSFEERRVLAQLERIRMDLIARRRAQLEALLKPDLDDATRRAVQTQLETLPQRCHVLRWTCSSGVEQWSCYTRGQRDRVLRHTPRPLQLQGRDQDRDPTAVALYLRDQRNAALDGIDLGSSIFVFCDVHPWLDRQDPRQYFDHRLVRAFRDLVHLVMTGREPSTIVLLSSRLVVPLELSKDMQVVEYPLPTAAELERRFLLSVPEILRTRGSDSVQLDREDRRRLMRALSGLTHDEAANVLARSLFNNDRLTAGDVQTALDEKRSIIRKDGSLEYFDSQVSFQGDVGGLSYLVTWLEQREDAFLGGVVDRNGTPITLPTPKGILMIGVPGGGKSLVAKACANAWKLPLLRLDMGRIFGSYVGESERNMRRAIQIAESIAPSVMWLDEVEKAFPRMSASTDSGASMRVLNTFLTWMQEKSLPVFVVATGNDVQALPPELTRKGRFDEIFYVGLPNQEAREQIFRIKARGLGLKDEDVERVARRSRWYTGAEIEQVVKNALYILSYWLTYPEQQPPHRADEDLLVRAMFRTMRDFVPLAARRNRDDQSVLALTLAQAQMVATKAAEFEPLPSDTDLRHARQPDDPEAELDEDGPDGAAEHNPLTRWS